MNVMDLDDPFVEDPITTWLRRSTIEERLDRFQILDSMVWAYVHRGLIFNAHIFQFDPAHVWFAHVVDDYFQHVRPEDVLEVCQSFSRFRPSGNPKPPIMCAVQFDVDQPQPVQPSFMNTSHLKDHSWRALISDHNHAMSVMWEYEAAGKHTAQAMIRRMVEKNNDDDNHRRDEEVMNLIRFDPQEAKKYVRELFLAVVDFTDVLDNPVKVRPPKASVDNPQVQPANPGVKDNLQVTRVKNAPNILLEAMCWILLDAIIDAQQGNIRISPWQELVGKALYETCGNFMDRFLAVVEAVRKSKALIDNLMQCDILRSLAATPEQQLRRKKANKATNAQRAIQLQAGNRVLRGLTPADGEGSAPAPDEADADGEDEH